MNRRVSLKVAFSLVRRLDANPHPITGLQLGAVMAALSRLAPRDRQLVERSAVVRGTRWAIAWQLAVLEYGTNPMSGDDAGDDLDGDVDSGLDTSYLGDVDVTDLFDPNERYYTEIEHSAKTLSDLSHVEALDESGVSSFWTEVRHGR